MHAQTNTKALDIDQLNKGMLREDLKRDTYKSKDVKMKKRNEVMGTNKNLV